jgi:hypothetical protein
LTPDQASTVSPAAVAKKLSSSIYLLYVLLPGGPGALLACGKLSIVDSEKTNLGDRDLSPGRHFSINIKQGGIDEFGDEGLITFFLR